MKKFNFKILPYLRNLLFASTLIAFGFSNSSARSLTGESVDWEPHYGEALEDGGPLTIITRLAFERGGHDAQFAFTAWNRAIKNVLEGKSDFVWGAYYNEERAKDYHMSDPVYYTDTGVIALNSLKFKTMDGLESLKPYTIGINLGYANTEEFDAADFLTKEIASKPILNIRKLYRKRVDMIFGSIDVVRHQAEKNNFPVSELVFIQPPMKSNALHLLISRNIADGAEILADFNRGLAEILADGTLDQVLRDHLGRQ